MLTFLADENFNARIVRGIRRRLPTLDLVTVQEVGLAGQADPDILSWATEQGRPLLTHDVATMIQHAWDRVRGDLPMAGLIVVPSTASIGLMIEDLTFLASNIEAIEFENQVLYLPL